MTDTATIAHAPADSHSSNGTTRPPPPPTGIHRFTGPGWLQGALDDAARRLRRARRSSSSIRWAGPLASVSGTASRSSPSATVTFPFGLLIGIGSFDYWAYYFSGKPTRPEDHSGHGARKWQDYFRPNTDHKVIGVQYLATTMTFFVIGGFLAMLFRAELARPGDQYFNPQTFNVLISEHAALMIFGVVVPVFAGLGNFVIPLMIGSADMAFPRLNALSFWLLPIGGVVMLVGMVTPGGGPSAGWTCYAPLCSHQPLGQVFFNMGVQWAGASSILTALNFLVTIITMRAPGMTFWRMPLLVLGELLHLDARRARDAVHRRLAVLRPLRPRDAHELLRTGGRRLRAGLPAHLLVLLPPGRLHHDPARLRDHQRGRRA